MPLIAISKSNPKTTIFCRSGEKEKALKFNNFRALLHFAI
ncbi:hypothetical protein BN890_13260 [Bacteroides xylanisolvens SD CC 1b]|jgi:hypothetical protein|uniref:Uncharacterized protein n=1 Tax=Bacteroides xylanisolvens SD CC 1b TaxID=702447 RepID=W6P267_9BACE|nr:hypothetical protein BN891_9960 [Bacteroides xylanisolvens SD CC 2a]CDM03759.1 hypothetical protein BN890_13260 [Bacteroides xylanisolvens SD CC 1b]